jgi:hypothetical protein
LSEEAIILTESALQKACALWQKRLRLQDWDVRVRVRRKAQMSAEKCRACVDADLRLKEALIEIQDPIDYTPKIWVNDMEQSLVHELLHLHFAPFEAEEGTAELVAQEQAIELIACALVNLARGER